MPSGRAVSWPRNEMRGFLSKHELLWPRFVGVVGGGKWRRDRGDMALSASTWSLWSRFGDIFSIIPHGHEVGISESANCSRNKDWPDLRMT